MPVLRKINGTDYEGSTNSTVTIVAVSRNNNGVEDASFEYDGTVLPDSATQGHPSCQFDLKNGNKTFEVLVTFDPGSPTARYDLFEVDGGTLVDLRKSRTANDPNGRIGIRIAGVPPTLAGAAAEVAAKKSPAKKKAALNKATAKKSSKPTAKKPQKPRL